MASSLIECKPQSKTVSRETDWALTRTRAVPWYRTFPQMYPKHKPCGTKRKRNKNWDSLQKGFLSYMDREVLRATGCLAWPRGPNPDPKDPTRRVISVSGRNSYRNAHNFEVRYRPTEDPGLRNKHRSSLKHPVGTKQIKSSCKNINELKVDVRN